MRVRGKNFLSLAELDFTVRKGVTLIRGYNHDDGTEEGAGKSAILNLISWTFFGEIPKEANIDDVVKEGTKHCEGLVDLPEFSVFRSRGPNDLHIKFPNGQVFRGKDANETQKKVVKLLGMSFKTFCQSVYFAQNYPKKFVTANQEDKGKILSEILDLEQFDRARKLAGDRIKPVKDELVQAEKNHLEFKVRVENEGKSIDSYKQLIEEFQRDKVSKIRSMLEEHEKISGEAENYLIEFNAEKADKIRKFNEEIVELKKVLEGLRKDHQAMKAEEKERSRHDYKGDLKALEEKLEAVRAEREEAKSKLALVDAEERAQSRRIRERSDIHNKLGEIDGEIESKAEMIKEAQGDVDALLEELIAVEKVRDNPDKKNCPTCGQLWDGDPKHFDREVEKAKNLVSRAEKTRFNLESDMLSLTKKAKDLADKANQLTAEIEEYKPQKTSKLNKIVENCDRDAAEIKAAIKQVQAEERKAYDLGLNLKVIEGHIKRHSEEERDAIYQREETMELSPARAMEKFERRAKELEAKIQEEDSKEPTSLEAKLKAANVAYGKAVAGYEDAALREDALKLKIARLEGLRDGFREVKAYTFERTLTQLTSKANLYMQQLFNQNVHIKFKNEDLKIETTVKIDGHERPLGLYSGGQFRRIALAVDLALADITLSRKGNKLNLMILDEYFKDLSATSMTRILKILQSRKTPTLLIEHNDLFKAIVDQTVTVELRKGTSSVTI